MQLLSAYLLESPKLSEAELSSRFSQVRELITQWLKVDKEVDDPWAQAGDFESLTKDGSGSFSRQQVTVQSGSLEEVRLEEFTRAGQIFTTHITVVLFGERLRVYCTLNVANAESVIAPIPVDPRCPSIVRTLLGASTDWQLNRSPLPAPKASSMRGETGGRALANAIRDPSRSLPLVVVSEIEGEFLWPRLPEELAFDLAALAQVVTIDDEATWALSDEVGKLRSCYNGAVRLYWPPRTRADGEVFFDSSVWTASVLLSNDRDGKGFNRVRSTLRRTLMSTAALSITPPPAMREIHDAKARARLEELERQAEPNSKELAEAKRYALENQDLRATIERLQNDLAMASARATSAEHALAQLKAPPLDGGDQSQVDPQTDEPLPGGVRFFKKTHSKSAYDVLVPVDDCGHTSWQASNKADKAKKGLERILGRYDWKTLQHCGTCTGGGMWKVRW